MRNCNNYNESKHTISMPNPIFVLNSSYLSSDKSNYCIFYDNDLYLDKILPVIQIHVFLLIIFYTWSASQYFRFFKFYFHILERRKKKRRIEDHLISQTVKRTLIGPWFVSEYVTFCWIKHKTAVYLSWYWNVEWMPARDQENNLFRYIGLKYVMMLTVIWL